MATIIGFFGGDSQVGTTMVAWSFAERLAEKGERVLLIFGSGSDDQAVIRADSGHSIDDLKASLRSGRLEREELFQSLEKKKDLWFLPGTKNSLTAEYFLENTYQVLFDGTLAAFDYVVIDGGSNVQLGLTISALQACSHRYFVLTQQAKAVHRFLQCRQHLLEPLELDGQVIINKYRKDPSLFLKKDVCKMIGTEAVTIPYVEEGWQAEMERRNLLGYSRFARAIDGMVQPFAQKGKKEKRWKRRFI